MPAEWHCSRIDTFELKVQIERKLGQQKAEKYFSLLNQFLSLKLNKVEFHKQCVGLVGRENVRLHNELIWAILKNATDGKTPPPKQRKVETPLNVKVPNGFQRSSLQSLCREAFPKSPRKGRTHNLRDRKFKDRPSPLGPHGKIHTVACEDLAPKVLEQQSATELLSLGSRPPAEVNSVEDGEEVEQAAGSPGIYSRSPVRAPLGISIPTKETRKVLRHGSDPAFYSQTCHNSGELPDSSSLKKRLEQKLEMEGLNISMDCVNLLNSGLDVFMKRLIKPTLGLAGSRSEHKHLNQSQYQVASCLNGMRPTKYIQKPNRSFAASMLDFRLAMELNPRILGEDWPVQFERVSLRASEESVGTDHASQFVPK
ncbi:hypothetical protein RJ639_003662 [Escallonia herrerae]|uniref:Transcriptional adapter 1 n=1 Tax=Escallonia herrerae TaxID=1293975 RepID=A0AA89AWE0_9ASTE|nr:hypothetical protein RJ639_003662 [Escallonia herrerae]